MNEAVDHWLDMEERRSAWSALLDVCQDPDATAIVRAVVAELDEAIVSVRLELAHGDH